MHSERKHMTEPVVIDKAKSFYGEIKITDNCTFSEGWLQNFKEPAAEGDIQMEYSSDELCSPNMGAVAKSYL
jgi:hypothetical protein